MIKQIEIELPSYNRGIYLITDIITEKVNELLPEYGLVNLFLKHTSAGITINENADPSVMADMNEFLNRLIPENLSYFTHTYEGPDDMPAHIKASVIGQTITVPVTQHKMNLGTWQGIYFCEFRNYSSKRKILVTIYN